MLSHFRSKQKDVMSRGSSTLSLFSSLLSPRPKGADFGIALGLILLAISLRLLPHSPNFAPVAAVAIFGGAMLPRRLAIAVPLTVIIVTDLIIGLHDLILVTWGSYALIALASNVWLSKKLSLKRSAALTLGASLFFFLTTNFAVWLASGMYEHTLVGLQQSFVLALPFFRNTLLSDLLYSGSLFGLYYAAKQISYKILTLDQSTT